mgnify:CR=1 FL=1
MTHRNYPHVNAGSMADIAFLLLIFFLVTTTIQTDEGISKKLPKKNINRPDVKIKEKNLFTILINAQGDLLVENEPMQIKDLKASAIAFIDNGGGTGDRTCDYCQGDQNPLSSDHPEKAVFSITTDRQTKYAHYIAVQNELVSAYNTLRNREANRLYGTTYTKMNAEYKTEESASRKAFLKKRLKTIRDLYPEHISDGQPVSASQ